MHIIIVKLYPYSTIIFVKLKPYKLVLSELFQQKCEKSFQKILPRQKVYFTLLHNH